MGPVTPRSSMSSSAHVAHAARALEPDGVLRQQVLVLVHAPGKLIDERPHALLPPPRRLERQPADAEVARHHALPGVHLEDAQNLLALAEAVEEHAHRADIDGVRPQPNQVAVEARQLGEHHPRPLRHGRDLEPQQLLHRQAVAQVVRERRQVVDAVGQRHRLLPRLDLELLFDARVQVADMRAGTRRWSRRPGPAPAAARRASRDAAAPCSGGACAASSFRSSRSFRPAAP